MIFNHLLRLVETVRGAGHIYDSGFVGESVYERVYQHLVGIISFQQLKARLVVSIVEWVSALSDRWLKSSSAPSLSQETYPNSSQITRSYFPLTHNTLYSAG